MSAYPSNISHYGVNDMSLQIICNVIICILQS